MTDRQAAGQAFTVFPPAWTPAVSRLTTDSALLKAALVAGREAVNVLFDEYRSAVSGQRATAARLIGYGGLCETLFEKVESGCCME
jgi:hypothetical protein